MFPTRDKGLLEVKLTSTEYADHMIVELREDGPAGIAAVGVGLKTDRGLTAEMSAFVYETTGIQRRLDVAFGPAPVELEEVFLIRAVSFCCVVQAVQHTSCQVSVG